MRNKINRSLTIHPDTSRFARRYARKGCTSSVPTFKSKLLQKSIMKALITTIAALSLGATLCMAQDKPPGPPPGGGEGGPGGGGRPNPEEAFKKLDTNGDGSVSLEEFKAGPMAQRNPERADVAFKRMDKDGDGK